MGTIDKAKEIAERIHKNDKRWNGSPYIKHPEAVANIVKLDNGKIVAWIHDCIEDHPESLSLIDLQKEGFSDEILHAISAITKGNEENYLQYILRVSNNKLAIIVKMADIVHNCQDIKAGSMKDKYMLAYYLLEKIALRDKGFDPNLFLTENLYERI